MRRTIAVVRAALLIGAMLVWASACSAIPPAERIAALSRGVNITGWFRYPVSRDPAALRRWLSDKAMTGLGHAGFTFVRLAVDPALLDQPQARQVFIDQVRRLQNHGLAVVISPHPVSWSMPADSSRLIAFWHDLAPALRGLTPAMTFPEVLNEPVFRDDPAAWWSLQLELHAIIRAALPGVTIVLTGHDWGSIAGLLALTPIADPNVVYSFHFYDPAELTSLAAYRPGLDRSALARLPFPETGRAECASVAGTTGDQATGELIRFWCATNWDAARVRSRIQEAAEWAKGHGVALLAGEFGASAALNSVSRLGWLRLVRETCASNGIGWALWGYDDVMGFNIARPPGTNPVLDRSILGALGLVVR